MGLRTNPTYRQRRFGAELRRLRQGAGLSATDAALVLGMNQSQFSNIEAGRTGLSPDRVRQLARHIGSKNDTIIEALIEYGQESGKGWWGAYRETLSDAHLDLAELEASAATLRSYEPLFIPGLLQTRAYATAVHVGAVAESARPFHAKAVEFKAERQKILRRERPPRLHAVIHEAALRMLYGGREVMRDQLLWLIEMSRLPNVTIAVTPLDAEQHVAFAHSFLLIEPAAAELGAVHVDLTATAQFQGDPESLAEYRRFFARVSELALPPIDADAAPEARTAKDSLGLVQHILYPLL